MRFSKVMIAMSSRWLCSARQMQLNSHCCWNHSSHGAFFGLHWGQGDMSKVSQRGTSSNMEFQHWDFLCLFMPPHQFMFDQLCGLLVWIRFKTFSIGIIGTIHFMAPKVTRGASSIRRLQEQRGTSQVMSSAPICTEMWARRGTQLTAEMERFWS